MSRARNVILSIDRRIGFSFFTRPLKKRSKNRSDVSEWKRRERVVVAFVDASNGTNPRFVYERRRHYAGRKNEDRSVLDDEPRFIRSVPRASRILRS